MIKIGSVFWADVRKFVTKRTLIVLLLTLSICTCFVLINISEYKSMKSNCDDFRKSESEMVKNYRNYDEYGKIGVHILSVPDAPSTLFSSPSEYSELSARVNSVAVLEIYDGRKNSMTKNSGTPISLNFPIVILIILSFASLYFGTTIVKEQQYLLTMSSLTKLSSAKLMLTLLFSKFILILLSFLAIALSMVGVVLVFGVNISSHDIFYLFGYTIGGSIVILVFLFLGALVGRIRRKRIFYSVFFSVWIGIVFGLPAFSNVLIEVLEVEVTSTYRVFSDILSNINGFEKRAVEEFGRFDRKDIELRRKVLKSYKENELKENIAMEGRVCEQMANNKTVYNNISIFNPVSFYLQTTSAVGSRSKDNLIEFYKYSQTIKLKFFDFIVERTYYNDPKVKVSFVKDDENLFYAQSHLPPNFWTGVFWNLFIVLVLGVVTFFVYRRDDTNAKFVIVPRVPPGEMNSNISYNRYSALYVKNDRLRDFLFKLFSGVIPGSLKAADWSLKIDDVDVFSEEFQGDFFYICRPGDIPGDIKVKNFLSFFASLGGVPSDQKESILAATELQKLMNKRFHQLEDAESFEVMFSLTRLVKRKVYLVDDILGDLGHTYALRMLKRMMEIGKKGDIILYLTHRLRAPEKMEEFNGDVDFCRGDTWLYDLKSRGLVLED